MSAMRNHFQQWMNSGSPWVWFTAGAVSLSLVMVFGLLGLIAGNGLGHFWPSRLALVELEEGVRMLGELRNVDPAAVEIGMPVSATYIDFPAGEGGPAWTLYAWEPAS